MIIGPFRQLLTLSALPLRGKLLDQQLEIVQDAGILVRGDYVVEIGILDELIFRFPQEEVHRIEGDFVAFPGMIDAHTHICWAGTRAADYALRLSGKTYLDIAKSGGGIMDTVRKTREASIEELVELTVLRADELLSRGVTTIEVKSGYGLTVDDELKMLEAIRRANQITAADLIPTCLAAHVIPPEFKQETPSAVTTSVLAHSTQHDTANTHDDGEISTVSSTSENLISSERRYLEYLITNLLPRLKRNKLTTRVDIFIEDGAFSMEAAHDYLLKAREMGFDLVLHGDQFTGNSAGLANEVKALSIDHLEAADITEIITLANGNTIPIVLPGASIGLGEPYAPARKLLDAGTSLVIASDWNPGSAPMGSLLTQAAILGAAQRLTMAEVWAAITCRAASALKLADRGCLQAGMKADVIAFKTNDYREVLYRQGELRPQLIFKNGVLLT